MCDTTVLRVQACGKDLDQQGCTFMNELMLITRELETLSSNSCTFGHRTPSPTNGPDHLLSPKKLQLVGLALWLLKP